MIRRQRTRDGVKLTFVIPETQASGRVSVVGDFNAWTPGQHTLVKRSNGTRSVAVTLPAGGEYRFRYLGEQGRWFDDPDVEAFAGPDGVVTV